jgi:uncharacterized HhH-GPD family protein
MTLHITGDAAADALLNDDPFALLTGMLLDQQVPMETAFAGPSKIRDRIGGIEPAVIAAFDPDSFADVFRATPAVHRFPGSMAARVQALAGVIARDWDGDASALWTSGTPDGAEILRRLRTLPGFGEQKAKIFLAILGKRFALAAPGWREASAPYGQDGAHASVADIVDVDSLTRVRETKRAAKAAAKTTS